MVRISVLHDALKTMNNAERKGKRQALVRPSSKVVIKFLQVMMKHGASGVRLAASVQGSTACFLACGVINVFGMLACHQPVLQGRSVQEPAPAPPRCTSLAQAGCLAAIAVWF